MKKIFSILFVSIILITGLVSASFTSNAETSFDVTYEENFEFGDTDIYTFENCGSAKILKEDDGNHVLHFKGNKDLYSLSCFGPYSADFDVSFRIRHKTLAGDFSMSKLLFHSDWGEHNTFRINFYNYRVTADFVDDATDTVKTLDENTDFKIEDNVWYTIQVFARKTEYYVLINGQKALNFDFKENQEGCFGFVGWQTEFDVDDISIIEYNDETAPILPEEITGTNEFENEIIEVHRSIRKMNNPFISVSNSSEALVKEIVVFSAFSIAAFSAVVLIVLFFIEIRRRRTKSKSKDEGDYYE